MKKIEPGIGRIIFAIWFAVLTLLFFFRGYTVITLFLLFTAAYIVVAFAAVKFGGKYINVSMTGGDLIEKNEPADVMVSITNEGKMPVFCCTCDMEATNCITGTSKHQQRDFIISPVSKVDVHMTVQDDCCGMIKVKPSSLTIWDPMKLFKSEGTKADREAKVYIAPQLRKMHIPEDWMDSYNMESYQYSQHEKGSDPGEVFGVREYREGDSPKQIHWKLSAKLEEMIVKIPSFPIENNILVILDNLIDPETEMDAGMRSRLIEDFSSLSMTLAEKGVPHSIGWYSVDDQSFSVRRVRDRDELMQNIPNILGCGFAESDVSTVYRYLEEQDGHDFSNHFIVTSQAGRDSDRLESHGAVKIFRAGI